MLQVEQAQEKILAGIESLASEAVPLSEAAGRVLTSVLVAVRNQPPEDNSAMDGYAVCWPDVAALHSGGSEVRLTVVRTIAAGAPAGGAIAAGEAARIMTGASVPPGTGLVVMRESTESQGEGAAVLIRSCGGEGDNIRRAGEDVARGDVFLRAGRALSAADLGLLASQGMGTAPCSKKPVVAIISTGDEVQPLGTELRSGHIYSSNSFTLAALVREAGGEVRDLGIARDNPESIRAVFEQARGADAVVSIGGVSVGDFDYVKEVLAELGAEQDFWKVAMRPGKPNACGRIFGIPWFGLPGNPVSSAISFLQYVRPALLRMQSASAVFLPVVDARLSHDVSSREGFLFLLRGVLRFDPAIGGYEVRTTGPQGSGIMSSLSRANSLIVVPEDRSSLAAGEMVRVQLLPQALAGGVRPELRSAP